MLREIEAASFTHSTIAVLCVHKALRSACVNENMYTEDCCTAERLVG